MLMPVRCFSCGAVVADKWEEFEKKVKIEKKDPEVALDELGVKRICCRRMFVGNVELIDDIIQYGR